MKDVSALIDEVLALPDLLPSTQEDLEDFKRDIAEGELTKDDREYVVALHERLVGGGGIPAVADDDEDEYDDDDGALEALQAEVDELNQALAERNARISELEAELEAARSKSDDS